jgi:hypothetical protein
VGVDEMLTEVSSRFRIDALELGETEVRIGDMCNLHLSLFLFFQCSHKGRPGMVKLSGPVIRYLIVTSQY